MASLDERRQLARIQGTVDAAVRTHTGRRGGHMTLLVQAGPTDQVIGSGAHTTLQPTVNLDTGSGYSSGIFTVPANGFYLFGGNVFSQGAASGNAAHFLFSVFVDRTGVGDAFAEEARNSAYPANLTTASQGCACSYPTSLEKGDLVKFTCWQDTASNLTVKASVSIIQLYV